MADESILINKSPVTGDEYYSGPSTNVSDMMKQLEVENLEVIETLAVNDVDTVRINSFQEIIDREIDDLLRGFCCVPVSKIYSGAPPNRKSYFPGSIREIAILKTAARILRSEFFDVNPNQSDAITQYDQRADNMLNRIIADLERVPGHQRKSRSRTAPPAMEQRRDPIESGILPT